jgi:hypothetical protein
MYFSIVLLVIDYPAFVSGKSYGKHLFYASKWIARFSLIPIALHPE